MSGRTDTTRCRGTASRPKPLFVTTTTILVLYYSYSKHMMVGVKSFTRNTFTMRRRAAIGTPTSYVPTSMMVTSRSCSSLSSTTKTKNQRKSQPYVESYEEQQVREFWESYPFRIATNLVDSIVDLNSNKNCRNSRNRMWLEKISNHLDNISGEPQSDYEDLFDDIYYNNTNRPRAPTTRRHVTTNNSLPENDTIQLTTENKRSIVRSYQLQIAYRGDAFCGFQIQPNNPNQPSVQGVLEDHLTEILYPPELFVRHDGNVSSSDLLAQINR